MYYIFPFSQVRPGSKIVLYGGGIAGQNYLQQIRTLNFCEVICIVDQNWRQKRIREMQVIPLERLAEFEFDFIVITPVKASLQESIQAELLDFGISKAKIISYPAQEMEWLHPDVGWHSQAEECAWGMKLGDYLQRIDPALLVSSSRIDIVIRYLLFRDFFWRVENKQHISLFSRYTLVRTGGDRASQLLFRRGKEIHRGFSGTREATLLEHGAGGVSSGSLHSFGA